MPKIIDIQIQESQVKHTCQLANKLKRESKRYHSKPGKNYKFGVKPLNLDD